MLISDMTELQAYLQQVQLRRETELRCELSPAFSDRVNDMGLVEALTMGLPMAQGIQHRLVRSRGRGIVLTAKLRYREGVRMLACCSGEQPLTQDESAALAVACQIAEKAMSCENEETCFVYLYDWICQNIRYVHTAPGQKGYERLVGAGGVLQYRQANCQGFADLLYLLCGLSGLKCEYRIGRGDRRLHAWNAVWLNGAWREADASKGARRLKTDS